jgi:uncharacterized phage protein (TIGR01671 family)
MREILFRGKRADNGEWIEGDFCHPCNIIFKKIGYDDVLEQDNVPIIHDYEVIPETVGQYTGLKDKNGKKIFEGDILDCGDRVVFVEWHSKCGTWDSKFIKYKGELCSNGITPVEWKFRAIIIGNIHDNPELLEVHNGKID